MKKDPAEVLGSARKNYENKKYAEALKEYKWFFDNSTKIESAMFGVKLSYCVGEWRKLGDSYEPALNLYRAELQDRKQRLLDGESNWELFMEFCALCDYDSRKNEAIYLLTVLEKSNRSDDFDKVKNKLQSYKFSSEIKAFLDELNNK